MTVRAKRLLIWTLLIGSVLIWRSKRLLMWAFVIGFLAFCIATEPGGWR